MTIGITVPAAKETRVINGFVELFENQRKLDPVTQEPIETDEELTNRMIKRFVKNSVLRGEQKKAQDAAKAALASFNI